MTVTLLETIKYREAGIYAMKQTWMQERIETFLRGYVEVDLDAITENMYHMKEHISPNTKMIAVIKTNGYGHGSYPIAQALHQLDFVYGYAVATAEEAHELRQEGIRKPILVLGYTFPYSYEMLASEEIRPAVFRYDMIPQLAQASRKTGKKVKVHIAVDTGMSRIGITPDEEGLGFVKALLEEPALEVEGIFTHFANADEEDKTSAREQLAKFEEFIQLIETKTGYQIPVKHCSNSAGILELPEANMDVVRAGITMYGLYPSDEVRKDIVPLRPALSLYSHVTFIKTIHKGQKVSYGGTYTAEKDVRVATVPLGYGDGYPRSLSNCGYVLIRGQRVPIIGRICMDQFMVDVSSLPCVEEGDTVTLIGYDGEEHISAEELGDLSHRFNYELVCNLSLRIPRVYLLNGVPVCIQE